MKTTKPDPVQVRKNYRDLRKYTEKVDTDTDTDTDIDTDTDRDEINF